MLENLLTFKFSGVIFNTITVIVGSLIGITLKRGISKKLCDAVMCGVGLCTLYIGISGAISASSDPAANPIITVISVALGVFIGTAADIDAMLCRLGEAVEKRFKSSCSKNIAEGFVSDVIAFR